MNVVNKITGDTYLATEFTEFKNESQNAITSSGQTLTANSVQLKQALARYANASSSYTDAGIADAYVLNAIASFDAPSVYLDGMKVAFVAGNTNTGASTVNVNSIGVKAIKKNGFADNLDAGDIVSGSVYELIYSLSSDLFELVALSATTAGDGGFTVTVVTGNTNIVDKTIFIANAGAQLEFTLPTTFTNIQFAIAGKGAGGWIVKSNVAATAQKIVFNDSESQTSSSSSIELFESISQFGYASFLGITDDSVVSVTSNGGGRISGVNYFGDGSDGALNTGGNVSLTSTLDGDIVVRHYTDITINTGHTLTTTNRCRGLLLFADGDVQIDGTVDMTDRGCKANPTETSVTSDTPVPPTDGNPVGSSGIRFPFITAAGGDTLAAAEFQGTGNDLFGLISNFPALSANGDIIAIPRVGAAGGTDPGGSNVPGDPGDAGTGLQSGGGGTAGKGTVAINDGGSGTCFSGGVGNGGTFSGALPDASDFGGAGGDADPASTGSGGGAGNPGGAGSGAGNAGDDGTGGLIIIIASGTVTISGTGNILTAGSNGGNSDGGGDNPGGGGSAGGIIFIAHKGAFTNSGTVAAAGGTGGTGVPTIAGGAGGAGTVTTQLVS